MNEAPLSCPLLQQHVIFEVAQDDAHLDRGEPGCPAPLGLLTPHTHRWTGMWLMGSGGLPRRDSV